MDQFLERPYFTIYIQLCYEIYKAPNSKSNLCIFCLYILKNLFEKLMKLTVKNLVGSQA